MSTNEIKIGEVFETRNELGKRNFLFRSNNGKERSVGLEFSVILMDIISQQNMREKELLKMDFNSFKDLMDDDFKVLVELYQAFEKGVLLMPLILLQIKDISSYKRLLDRDLIIAQTPKNGKIHYGITTKGRQVVEADDLLNTDFGV
jgi:hypothetical protein